MNPLANVLSLPYRNFPASCPQQLGWNFTAANEDKGPISSNAITQSILGGAAADREPIRLGRISPPCGVCIAQRAMFGALEVILPVTRREAPSRRSAGTCPRRTGLHMGLLLSCHTLLNFLNFVK